MGEAMAALAVVVAQEGLPQDPTEVVVVAAAAIQVVVVVVSNVTAEVVVHLVRQVLQVCP